MMKSPTMLLQTLQSTSPAIYSDTERGVANILRKLRDQTSSKKAIVTPCMTRVKKSHKRTAPRKTGTKLKPEPETLFRYFVMKPQRIMSIATQRKSGETREKLPRMR